MDLLNVENKGAVLRQLIEACRRGEDGDRTYHIDLQSFARIPSAPLAYSTPEILLDLFRNFRPLDDFAACGVGLQTGDSFRFLRSWWEVEQGTLLTADAILGREQRPNETLSEACTALTLAERRWVPFGKPGDYQPYVARMGMVVNWKDDGKELDSYGGSYLRNRDSYFRAAIAVQRRSTLKICAALYPLGSIPSVDAPYVRMEEGSAIEALAFLNSDIAEALSFIFQPRSGGGQATTKKYESGTVRKLPFPNLPPHVLSSCHDVIAAIVSLLRQDETSRFFVSPLATGTDIEELSRLISSLEVSIGKSIVGREQEGGGGSDDGIGYKIRSPAEIGDQLRISLPDEGARLRARSVISYAVGLAFCRWDPKATSAPNQGEIPEGWTLPPGLRGTGNEASSPAFLVQDFLEAELSQELDLTDRVRQQWSDGVLTGQADPDELAQRIGFPGVGEYLHDPSGFFDAHLKHYSQGGRRAPLYWPLASPRNGFIVWLYYPRLNQDLLFKIITSVLDPRLSRLSRRVASVENKVEEADRKIAYERASLQEAIAEIESLKSTLERLTLLPYRPNLHDGVEICAAPLFELVQHRDWRTTLEERWLSLQGGECDWAHLALLLWPDRVHEACRNDQSLAIAHDLEHLYESSS